MWETFISWYINNYLGKYVENLNSQQLSFALRQGELELENVPLKKNIFRSWGLPVEIKSSVVGRIKIEFNLLKYLRNEPVLITIEDICLVAGPLNFSEWDPVEEEALAHEAKMSSLDAHESRWKAQFDMSSNSSSYYSSLYFSSMRIGASIVTKVVENLQLNVKNVHIRFEEEIGHHSRVVAFGFTLESLTAQSCDSQWNSFSSIPTGNSECSYKTLQLNKFGVYFDTKAEKFSDLNPLDLKTAMCKILPSHEYLLCPVSAEAKIAKNNASHPLPSSSQPRFDVFLNLEKVPLQLTDFQYRQLVRVYKSFKKLERNCRLRHYRPFRGVMGNAIEWWQYSVSAVLHIRGYKRRKLLKTWEEILQRAKDNLVYVRAYEKHLLRQLLSSDLQKLKDRMETELHYEEIVELRQLAMRRVEVSSHMNLANPANEDITPTDFEPSLPGSSIVKSNPISEDEGQGKSSHSGVLSWVFPSWTGWSSGASTSPAEDLDKVDSEVFLSPAHSEENIPSELQLHKSESDFDEAILDDVKAFGRDALLARFNFNLRQGNVTLRRKNGPFLELDFGGVALHTELKPRSGAHKFKMTLAKLLLKDCTTATMIASPHLSTPTLKHGLSSRPSKEIAEPLFCFLYERKPSKKTGNRITVVTKPLDLVIYPALYEEAGKYFTIKELDDDFEYPHNGYEAVKQKTKEELKTYWERLIHRKNTHLTGGAPSWEIHMDVYAPQIVIYGPKYRSTVSTITKERLVEDRTRRIHQQDSKMPFILQRPNVTPTPQPRCVPEPFLVIDFGRFRFTNVEEHNFNGSRELDTQEEEVDDSMSSDNEEFLTPCSSPVGEMDDSTCANSPRPSIPDISEIPTKSGDDLCFGDSLFDIQAKLYKKYRLEITDVQVIVVEGKAGRDGQWKSANSKGSSALHLVDRFSINLQLEHRLIYSEDPLWPALTIVATLPKLNLHFNETKVQTIHSVMDSFLKSKATPLERVEKFDLSFLSSSQINLADGDVSSHDVLAGDLADKTFEESSHPPEDKNNSKLFLAQFTIQNVSVELQSKGRSIAELQIMGARTSFTKRSVDTSISFVIHSLLLADAIQTFGPDFELLLASHKHVSMDSVSGSLRDSDPTSPMSPQSPSSPLPFANPKTYSNQLAIPSQLHDALVTSLQAKKKIGVSSIGTQTPTYDLDALITAELVFVNTDEELAILSVQFNNLDVIANQETIVEIWQFIQSVMPSSDSFPVDVKSVQESVLLHADKAKRFQASLDFHRLNILLLRDVIGKDGSQCARKIATATVCEAKVNISFNGESITTEGSLGGLQMLNLTPEGQYHQRILSVGQDPLLDSTYNVFTASGNQSTNEIPNQNDSALTFVYEKSTTADQKASPSLTLRMASVIYTHCPIFLLDLKKCIHQFQTPLTNKLKSAAAQIALGLVRQDNLQGIYGGFRSPLGSLSASLDPMDIEDDNGSVGDAANSSPVIRLDVVLDSPVIVLPKTRTSSEVLVANLGQITVTGNNRLSSDSQSSDTSAYHLSSTPDLPLDDDDTINYSVFIRDVSLYSLNLKERWSLIDNLKMTYPTSSSATLMRAQELYFCDPEIAVPILHNTVIQFNISYIEESPYVNPNEDGNHPCFGFADVDDETFGPKLNFRGLVVNPLKVSLTPQQYAQLLDSLSNISADGEDFNVNEVNAVERRMNWQKEISSFHRRIPEPLPLPSPTRNVDESLPISVFFEIPELIVELVLPDTHGKPMKEMPELSLSCSELSFQCEKFGYVTDMNVRLKSLILEDTCAPIGCNRRILAKSNTVDQNESEKVQSTSLISTVFHKNSFCSKSCPDLPKSSPIFIPETPVYGSQSLTRTESNSLPDHLDPSDILTGRFFQPGIGMKPNRTPARKRKYSIRYSNKREQEQEKKFCPATPPPSPRKSNIKKPNNLVQIQILLVDSKSPKFVSKFHGKHKLTDVEFNTLEVLLTPDTFASFRKFFSDASKHEEKEKVMAHSSSISRVLEKNPKVKFTSTSSSSTESSSSSTGTEERNTETRIHVKALRVKLAGAKETLAEAIVNSVVCEVTSVGKDYFGVEGRLGSLQVRDISPYSGIYPVKFVFQGKQALDFDYTRKELEGKFRLKMASVVCVHTHRFYSSFSALWSALFGRSPHDDVDLDRSSSLEQEDVVEANANHIRVLLDIQAGAPVLLFPYSSTSESILVADLGHLSVRNKFVEESSSTLFDMISVDLMEMDLYSAQLKNTFSDSVDQHINNVWRLDKHCDVIKSSRNPSFLKNKCALNLKVKRFVHGHLLERQANTSVQGMLSTVYCTLDCDKYKFIRGFLEHNIGEKIETAPPPTPNFRSRHMSGGRATPGSDCTPIGNPSKLELAVELDLVNVTLELVQESGLHLSRVDFVKSKFTFQNNSDGTKDVDLASQEILINDARFDVQDLIDKTEKKESSSHSDDSAKNVFKKILEQSVCHNISGDVSHGQNQSSLFRTGTPLQAEIHYRQTQRGTRVTIVLNNMRLMLILDWWMEIQAFLSQAVPAPPPLIVDDPESITEVEERKSQGRNVSPLLERSKDLASPVTVSAGIVTKRAPVLDIPNSTFELKINISNCELVMVEDPSVWDTNAVILKSTAVLWYRPHLERPISCSLMECELFSCIVGLESDSALSILDPTDITIELVRKTKVEPQGILDATTSPSASSKILTIQSPQLNLRLSYYDMKMFVQIMERFSKQAQIHLLRSETSSDLAILQETPEKRGYFVDETNLEQLVEMGFDKNTSAEALHICGGQVEQAALMLSQEPQPLKGSRKGSLSLDMSNANAVNPDDLLSPSNGGEHIGQLGILCGVEVKCLCLSLCVIDDCKDADVPFLELSVSQLELSQSLVDNSGRAECVLASDYYNRELSGWEPFLEPWKCTIAWKKSKAGALGHYLPTSEFPSKAPELGISIVSKQVVNLNITSTLLSLYRTVLANWSEDYFQQKFDRRRAPFVPFALENETGSSLYFSTILSNSDELIKQRKVGVSDQTKWINVPHGSTQPFSFEGRGKLRHRNTHQLRTHQLVVRLDGWQEILPVSVDKVGTYFRVAKAATSRRYGICNELPTTRLVFEVSVQGSAQKLVRVRSALKVFNSLPDTVELKLENSIVYPSLEDAQSLGSCIVKVLSGKVYSIPLHSVFAHMWVRPIQPSENFPTMHYCTKPLLLSNSQEGLRECSSMASHQNQPYRFCVAVKREEFPADEDDQDLENTVPTISQLMSMNKKANLVSLVSPLTIVNLLPTEINFEIKNYHLSGRIVAGKEFSMTNVDISESLEVFFSQSDSFPQGVTTTISAGTTGYVARLKVVDSAKRALLLTLRVQRGDGGCLTLLLSCPYWIVNKTGLPIVCKQEGTYEEAAGQFIENEMGRKADPLLFSFSDQEGASSLSLRIGNCLHKDSKPIWCRSFQLQSGTRVRKLVVKFSSSGTFTASKPEAVYLVGIEIKNGKGRYRDSKLVTISPHFVVDNRSSKAIKIAQRVFASSFSDYAAEATHLTLPANCSLPFHWPRLDKDQLLCAKLTDSEGGLWSGGFSIENVDSFHINIRNMEGQCHFLRVEIILQGSTFFVIFSDTDQLPPPFRVDNMSLVAITFHQTIVPEDRLKLTVRPESSCPYALDETTQPPNMTLAAPGGASVIVNMDVLGYTTYLTYENFFYIALASTFPRNDDESSLVRVGLETLELVLDVPEGTKVVLRKKEPGKRSQLWRVNADGLIEHEGSSPPRDPKKPSPGSMLVLDIAGTSVEPTQYVPLMLRKPDKQRASTQHWEFTTEGRLQCWYQNLFVQAKDGFGSASGTLHKSSPTSVVNSWNQWSDVVLGPSQPDLCYVRTESGIPAEQAVERQKLRPGSGRLALEVDTDGPTRVLRIVDTARTSRRNLPHHLFEEHSVNTIPRLLINVDLKSGLGISLINCKPREELLYAMFSNVRLKWSDSKKSQSLEASVENLQIDNSLFESEKYIAVYVTPTARYESLEDLSQTQPSLHLSWERMKSRLNAHVFKSLELIIKPLNVILEERLLLKLCQFFGWSQKLQSVDEMEDSDFEVQRALKNATSLTAKRYYFGILRLILNQVRLSVLTSKLAPDLALVKRRMGLTLIRFEEAVVELDDFIKLHPFETFEFLTASLIKHYRDELVSQAAIILGSTDFLGNPIGFVNDVSVGVSGLIYEGSIGSLVKNVTHGISNSAAKVTGSLGDGLGRTTLDDKHEEERRKIRVEHSCSSGEHLYAGLKGLGHGLIGGVTSIVAQSFEGVSNDGFTGFISGFGKGIVGTVTKPAVGILDLATGAASAIRDSSRTSSRMIPPRIRPTRVVVGNGGLLPPYSENAARGQEVLFEVNDRNYNELFIACESLKSGSNHDLKILISSEAVTVFKPGKGHPVIVKVPMSELIECHIPSLSGGYERNPYIEFVKKPPDLGKSRPQVKCESEQTAKKIVQQVNYAKVLYEEMRHSQIVKPVSIKDE